MAEKISGVLIVTLGVLIVISLFSSNITGNASKKQRNVDSCIDTDGGVDGNTAGAVITDYSGRQRYYTDACGQVTTSNSKTVYELVERYCGGKEVKSVTVECPAGTMCRSTSSGKYGTSARCV